MIPTLYIVGADKGGVGKTTITRTLLDFFRANGIDYKAFDTEHPSGALQRFFPEKATIVDLTKSNDQMKVFDDLASAPAHVIDVRAALLSDTLKLLAEIGFFEMEKANKLRIVTLHVLGPATQSLDEVSRVQKAIGASRYIAIANHINDTDFQSPEGALHIPKLDEEACKAVDKVALPFNDFTNSQASLVLRGKVRYWLGQVFEQFASTKLNVLS